MSIIEYLEKQIPWSTKTFGSSPRTLGIIQHITKELEGIKAKPHDLEEWVDVAILALDGAWRAGYTPQQIADKMAEKQAKNFARKWPTTKSEHEAVEHIK